MVLSCDVVSGGIIKKKIVLGINQYLLFHMSGQRWTVITILLIQYINTGSEKQKKIIQSVLEYSSNVILKLSGCLSLNSEESNFGLFGSKIKITSICSLLKYTHT